MWISLSFSPFFCCLTALLLHVQNVNSFINFSSQHEPHQLGKKLKLPIKLSNYSRGRGDYKMLVSGGYIVRSSILYRHIVSIRTVRATAYFGDNHICAGAIISDNLILTAAHCVIDRRKIVTRAHRLIVVAGAPNRLIRHTTTVEMKVLDVLPHHDFVRDGAHDIAILRLDGSFPDDNDFIKVIPLYESNIPNGTLCHIIGWGQLFYRGPYAADPICGDVTVFSYEYCRKIYPDVFDETMICADKVDTWDVDACRGDSGGPLICNGYVAAIVSWNSYCGSTKKPTVFTSVYRHRNFITMKLCKKLALMQFPLNILYIYYHLVSLLAYHANGYGLHGRRHHHNHSQEIGLPTDLANLTYDRGEYKMLITGGYRPSVNAFNKYVVSIRTSRATAYFGDNHFCVGSIISDNLILTAAHCVVDRRKVVTRPHRLVVVAGAPNRFQKPPTTVEMKVRNVLPHEQFKRKGAHDIALLRLADGFPDDNDFVKIIPLVNKMVKPGTSCQIVGWGQLFFRGPYSAYAIVANLTVFSQAYCKRFYRSLFDETMICAGRKGKWDVDACRGDSGGPLICDGQVVGTVSWGSYCGEKGRPTIFTSVYHHRDWIKMTSGSKNVRLRKLQFLFLFIQLIYFYI